MKNYLDMSEDQLNTEFSRLMSDWLDSSLANDPIDANIFLLSKLNLISNIMLLRGYKLKDHGTLVSLRRS